MTSPDGAAAKALSAYWDSFDRKGKGLGPVVREMDAAFNAGFLAGARWRQEVHANVNVSPPDCCADDPVWVDGFTSGVWMTRTAIRALDANGEEEGKLNGK